LSIATGSPLQLTNSTFSDANWISINPNIPGTDGTVRATVVDGSGNLYIGGSFTVVGEVVANGIAKWNGSRWTALGSGLGHTNTSITPAVFALAVSGSDLYVGGEFTTAGGNAANCIAKWDGSNWTALSSGMRGGQFSLAASVDALAVSGSDLYAGGWFTTAGGIPVDNIARWNGSSWTALGSGMNSRVSALAVSGSALYAGGVFTSPGSHIAKWNGSSWTTLPGMESSVQSLVVSGSDLYAGGWFTLVGGIRANYIAKWNGSSWTALGSGMSGPVSALTVLGNDLYAGGSFKTAGGVDIGYGMAKWNGSSWSALGSGMYGGVHTLAVSGSDLYAGGEFTTMGGIQPMGLPNGTGAIGARWARG